MTGRTLLERIVDSILDRRQAFPLLGRAPIVTPRKHGTRGPDGLLQAQLQHKHEIFRALHELQHHRSPLEPPYRHADGGYSPAMEELVKRQYAAIYNLAYRALPRREDARNIAQQTFARASERLARLSALPVDDTWLYRLAGELCFVEVRRRQRKGIWTGPDDAAWAAASSLDSLGASGAAPEHELRLKVMQAVVSLSSEQRLAVAPRGLYGVGYDEIAVALRLKAWQILLALPPEQRLALALRELHGVRYADIAEAMHTRAASVKKLLLQARRTLHRAYGASDEQQVPDPACARVQEWLSAAIDGEVRPDDQARTNLHLAVCERCEVANRELRAVSQLHALAPIVSPPAGAQAAALATLSGGTGKTARVMPEMGPARLGLAVTAVIVLSAGVAWTTGFPRSVASALAPRTATPVFVLSPLNDSTIPTSLPTVEPTLDRSVAIATAVPTTAPPTPTVAATSAATATAVPTPTATAGSIAAPTSAATATVVLGAAPTSATRVPDPAVASGVAAASTGPTAVPTTPPTPTAAATPPPTPTAVPTPSPTAAPTRAATATAVPTSRVEALTPVPTAAVQPSAREASKFTTSVALRVRSGPSVDSPGVDVAQSGTVLQILEGPIPSGENDYYHVLLPDGSRGYIAAAPSDLPHTVRPTISP
jgi:DNA-directed RNA polymerase specialized sigma24 family protein